MYDLIVIGAGPAGSSAAYTAASAGMNVLMLDSRSFPRSKLCGGALTPKAVKVLRNVFGDIDYPCVISNRFVMAGKGQTRQDLAVEIESRKEILRLIDRRSFDHILWKRAVESGALFFRDKVRRIQPTDEGFVVHALENDYESRFVIVGAGVFGSRLLETDTRNSYSLVYAANVKSEQEIPRMILFEKGYAWIFPGPESVSFGAGQHPEYGKIPYDTARNLIVQIGAKEVELRAAPLPIFDPEISIDLNRAVGGCLFVGDSGGFVDPWTGEGICFALDTGSQAVRSIARRFDDREGVNECFLENTHHIARHLSLGNAIRKAFFKNVKRSLEMSRDPRFSRMAIAFMERYTPRIGRLMVRGFFKRSVSVRVANVT